MLFAIFTIGCLRVGVRDLQLHVRLSQGWRVGPVALGRSASILPGGESVREGDGAAFRRSFHVIALVSYVERD